jgi:hypothetical protein
LGEDFDRGEEEGVGGAGEGAGEVEMAEDGDGEEAGIDVRSCEVGKRMVVFGQR